MPEWLKVIIGVVALITVSAGPGLYLEWLWLKQPHTLQSQRSPPKNRPGNTDHHDNSPDGIYGQPTPETTAPSREAQAPKLQEPATANRRTDLGNKDDGMDDLSAWATVAITIGLLIVAVVQARIYRNQARIMRAQLNTANIAARAARRSADAAKESADYTRMSIIASQRAWLTAEVSLVKGQEQINFSQDGAVLAICIDIKNIGNDPAIKVSWHAWLTFGLNPFQEQSRRCKEIRQQPFGLGPTVFPQEPYPVCSYGAGATLEEVSQTIAAQDGRRDILMPSLVGCVDYTFPTDLDAHHQRGFVYHLHVPDGQIPELTTQSIPVAVRGLVKANLTLDPGVD